jgi:4-hydroxy-4-methyl-2-oxoglutarate aldolase
MKSELTASQFEALRRLGTCTVANAIETFEVRLRNAGFADSSIRCMFEDFPPMVGYAAPARIRSTNPPMKGPSPYDRTDWWNYLLTIPAPRVAVLQDVDKKPGVGSFVGEVHAHILQALGCVGLVTNGAVRSLDRVKPSGFQLFAGNVAVSHAYAHIFEFGAPVEVGGLKISPGDILHADRHGVLTVPAEIAERVPAAAENVLALEKAIVGLCSSPQFSIERLRELLKI